MPSTWPPSTYTACVCGKWQTVTFCNNPSGAKRSLAPSVKNAQRWAFRGIWYYPNFGVELRGLLLNPLAYSMSEISWGTRSLIWTQNTPKSFQSLQYLASRHHVRANISWAGSAFSWHELLDEVGRTCAVPGYLDLFHKLNLSRRAISSKRHAKGQYGYLWCYRESWSQIPESVKEQIPQRGYIWKIIMDISPRALKVLQLQRKRHSPAFAAWF